MFFKLFICVLLVSHSLAEEEDDGQYSPEKYEKPYEDVPNEQVDESLANQLQQQSDSFSKAVPATNQQQQINPQTYQQQVIPEAYQQLQPAPQTYQQQQPNPPNYQQQINPLAYQQQIKPQSYQQQQEVFPTYQQQINPSAYQQHLAYQQQQAIPQTYQQQINPLAYQQQQLNSQAYQQIIAQSNQQKQGLQSVPQAYNQQQPATPLTYQQLQSYQQPQSYQQNPPLAQIQGDQKHIQQFQQQFAVPQAYQQAAAVPQFYQQSQAFPKTYIENPAQVSNVQQQLSPQQLPPIGGTNYQTDNGHRRSENVDSEGNVIGQYSYIDPNGKTITVRYSAGKDGFRVEGDHLPKAPQPLSGAPLESQRFGQATQYNLQALYSQQVQSAPVQ